MRKNSICIIAFLGILAIGASCWYWQLLRYIPIISRPNVSSYTESRTKPEEPQKTLTGWINILILGTDNIEEEVSRTDTIILALANLDTRQVSVISVPRDTRVNLEGVGLTKINHANVIGQMKGGIHQGTLKSAKAVSDLLGVNINYYVKIDFRGFKKAVDAVGGVDVDLAYPVIDKYHSKADFPAGEHHLSGKEALSLAQARHNLPHGDFDRQGHQFMLLSSLAHKMLNVFNISKLPEVMGIVYQELLDTNLSVAEMLKIGLTFKGITPDKIKYYQLPGKANTSYDPFVGSSLYYFEPDTEGVKKIVREAMSLN